MSQESVSQPPFVNQEAVVAPQTRGVEALSNNPGRALTYLLIAQCSEPQTPAEIGRRLGMLQGTDPGWRPTSGSLEGPPRTYCTSTLVPAGLVRAHPKISGTKSSLAFVARSEDSRPNIARAVNSLDWELQFPHHRLHDILGDTRIQTPRSLSLNSLDILRFLLSAPNGAASHIEIEEGLGLPRNLVQRTVRFLESSGSIEKLRKANLADRKIALLEPPASPNDPRRGPGAKALRAAVQSLRRRGCYTISGAALLEHAQELSPATESEAIRHILNHHPRPNYLQFINDEEFGRGYTLHRIAPQLKPAIADLILRLSLIDSDPHFVDASNKKASDILKVAADVALLMAKSRLQEDWPPKKQKIDIQTQARRGLASLTLQPLPKERRWEARAACSNTSDANFFPTGDAGPSTIEAERAKAICEKCPVIGSCLQWSLDTGQEEGIFGGMTPAERRKYRQKPSVSELQAIGRTHFSNWEISRQQEELSST